MAHVAITGASSGIGEALARAYLERGDRVTLVARRRDRLEALAATAKDRAHVAQADLGDPAAAEGWLDEAERVNGPLDVLVNNAGIQIVKSTLGTTWEEAERMLLLDLHTPLRLTQAALRRMVPRGTGTIVDIASMAAMYAPTGMYFYAAAKAGLAAASEGLRAEVKPLGIHVVTVYPGPVKSDMEAAAREAYEPGASMSYAPTGDAPTLAKLVVRAVEKKHARVIYPRVYGVSRHFPNLSRWVTDAFSPKLRLGR